MREIAMTGARCIPLFGLVLVIGAPVFAQTVTPGPDGTISVHAAQVPLATLLRAMAEISPFEKLDVDPEIESTPVTVDVKDSTLRSAVISVLDAAEGVDYVLSASPDGRRLRVVAGRTKGAGNLRAVPAPAQPAADMSETLARAPDAKKPVPEETAAEPVDASKDDVTPRTVEYLNAALAQRPTARTPGTVIELPFPGPDGAPLRTVVPPGGVSAASSGLPVGAPRTGAVAAPPSDPGLQALHGLLLQARRPGQ